jgi:hypothetical protein
MEPLGKIENIIDWDATQTLSKFDALVFETAVQTVKIKEKRNCQLQIQTNLPSSQVYINGFPVPSSNRVFLPGQKTHRVSVFAKGYATKEQFLKCGSEPTKKVMYFDLKKMLDPRATSLNDEFLSQIHTWILVQPQTKEFKLFLYTPNHALDEFPLDRSLKLEDLSIESDEAGMPIATDAAISLFEKHHLVENLGLSNGNEKYFKPLKRSEDSPDLAINHKIESPNTGETSWYKSPIFWSIIGGLASGAVITYFAVSPNRTEMAAGRKE